MTSALIVTYLATVTVIVLSPGPSTLLATSHGAAYGTRGTIPTILGDLSANVVQMTAAALGVGAIVVASREAFVAIKWAGVAYLAYLGWRQWRSHGRLRSSETATVRPRRRYIQGLVNSAANPKAVVFFAALFPQFIDPAGALAPQLLVMGGLFLLFDATALLLYASSGMSVGRWLTARGRSELGDRFSGGAMIAAAGLLALKGAPTR